MYVTLINENTDEVANIKVGFSWTVFFFGGLFGLPLFLRGLKELGLAICGLQLVSIFCSFFPETLLLSLLVVQPAGLFLILWSSFKANAMYGKKLIKEGWIFENEGSHAATQARSRWGYRSMQKTTATRTKPPRTRT